MPKATSAPSTTQELRASLDRLGRRLRQVAGHAQLDAGVRAAQWVEVERELLDLTPRVAEVEGEALDLGHPVLQDAAQWRDLVHAARLTEEQREGEALVERLLEAGNENAEQLETGFPPAAGEKYIAVVLQPEHRDHIDRNFLLPFRLELAQFLDTSDDEFAGQGIVGGAGLDQDAVHTHIQRTGERHAYRVRG